jgi:hypothetical protein
METFLDFKVSIGIYHYLTNAVQIAAVLSGSGGILKNLPDLPSINYQ